MASLQCSEVCEAALPTNQELGLKNDFNYSSPWKYVEREVWCKKFPSPIARKLMFGAPPPTVSMFQSVKGGVTVSRMVR